MDKSASKSFFGIAIALGAVWGLSEAALGMGLRSCAAFVSGALMTGVALFFIAAGWVITRRVLGVALMILIAAGFKMFDALLLGYALNHGAIGNPIFSFVMEGLAFLVIVAVLKRTLTQKPTGQALAGGMSALLAANLFPLVRFATGVPACVAAGTGYPRFPWVSGWARASGPGNRGSQSRARAAGGPSSCLRQPLPSAWPSWHSSALSEPDSV